MRRAVAWLLFPLLLISCGEAADVVHGVGNVLSPSRQWNDELADIVEEYREDAYRRGIPINFSPLKTLHFSSSLDPGTNGVCRLTWAVGRLLLWGAEVEVADKLREGGTPRTLRATVYHELGHCLHHLDHSPSGLMRDKSYFEREYGENWEELIDEYFQEVRETI